MKTFKKELSPFWILAIIGGLFFVFLVFRNMGLYPTVFADEYSYSMLSRLQPMSSSSIPSYVYLKIYSATNYCHDGFLDCAKIFNSAFFVSAAPFIFLICRRVADNKTSLIVSSLAIFGPISSYTAFFMPESLYFLSFWIFCWYLTGLDVQSERYRWFFAGIIYAFSILVKPHSIFFLPAIIIYIAYIFSRSDVLPGRNFVLAFVLFIFGVSLVKFGLSYVLAGSAGLTIFGPMYNSVAVSAATGADKYIPLLLLSIETFKGHMLVLALVYGLPLALGISVVGRMILNYRSKGMDKSIRNAHYEKVVLLALLIVINLICVASIFTASMANSGPYETPYRLHMRYYNFALPLFYILTAGALFSLDEIKRSMRYVIGGLIAILGVYALLSNLAPYTPSQVDSPEIRGLHVERLYFRTVGGFLVLALAIWTVFARKGIELYLYLVLPLFIGVSSYNIQVEQNRRLNKDVYDQAGIFAKQYLSDDEVSKVIVVGSEGAGLFRTLFYIDNIKASLDVIAVGADYDLAKADATKAWVLMIGNHKLIGGSAYAVPMKGFSLFRISKLGSP